MKQYYDNKKYYINRALKIASKYNNQGAIDALNLIKRHSNVVTLEYIKKVNEIYKGKIDLFNIEGITNEVL